MMPPAPPDPNVQLLSYSKATLKQQIANRKSNITNLVEEVYAQFPHMFPIPPVNEGYDDEELENSIWMFIKKNNRHRPGISIEQR